MARIVLEKAIFLVVWKERNEKIRKGVKSKMILNKDNYDFFLLIYLFFEVLILIPIKKLIWIEVKLTFDRVQLVVSQFE